MDEWLAEARYGYSLSVRAKYGEQYPLTEIWDPFVNSVRKIAKGLNDNLGIEFEVFQELRDLPAITNSLAAHENNFAREIPRDVMVGIARKILGLVIA